MVYVFSTYHLLSKAANFLYPAYKHALEVSGEIEFWHIPFAIFLVFLLFLLYQLLKDFSFIDGIIGLFGFFLILGIIGYLFSSDKDTNSSDKDTKDEDPLGIKDELERIIRNGLS